jgi:hypothetical protein
MHQIIEAEKAEQSAAVHPEDKRHGEQYRPETNETLTSEHP